MLILIFQSTPPARGATNAVYAKNGCGRISIHAPREGGDGVTWQATEEDYISIHAPREGGDVLLPNLKTLFMHFNPRPPRGGRRALHRGGVQGRQDFNPRPPRGGRPPSQPPLMRTA